MPGEEERVSESLAELMNEMKERFLSHGFACRITVDETTSLETIEFKFVRDNTRDVAWGMVT